MHRNIMKPEVFLFAGTVSILELSTDITNNEPITFYKRKSYLFIVYPIHIFIIYILRLDIIIGYPINYYMLIKKFQKIRKYFIKELKKIF